MNCATTSQEDKGFNSKLVRLEEMRTCAEWHMWRFNSKLVRLEVVGRGADKSVSIPNWFD